MSKILFALLLIASGGLAPEDFKILFVNTKTIKIGGEIKSAGDTFNDADKITWKDEKQAMKVVSLDSKKQYVLVSEDFKRRKMKSAKDFIIKNNRLSTRGIGSLSSVAMQVGDRLYWIEPVLVSIDYQPGEGEYFFIMNNGKEHRLAVENGQLVFDAGIWEGLEPYHIEVELLYHYPSGEEESVNPALVVEPLPKVVEYKKRWF